MPPRRQPVRPLWKPALSGGVALCGVLLAASAPLRAQLPATPPTSVPAAMTPAREIPVRNTADIRPRHAGVTYREGQLEVRADNSSLNGILVEISRATGMKISGGVRDQRVFGHYGPASPGEVLAALLDGTGTNILLRENPGEAPVELVLTPRTGGPTPPSPSAPTSYADDSNAPGNGQDSDMIDQVLPGGGRPRPTSIPGRPGINPGLPPVQQQPGGMSGEPSGPPPQNNPLGSPDNTTNTVSTMPTTNSVPTDSLPSPTTATQTQQGIVDSPNPPPADSTTSSSTGATTSGTTSSPNGVSSPEQIYQQLLKLQQQNSTNSSTSTQGTTPPPQ